MKKLLIVVIALITSANFAQEKKKEHNSEAMAQKKVEKMTAELNLNKEQQGQIFELYKKKDYRHKSKFQKRNRDEVKKDKHERKKAEMNKKAEKHKAAMKEILTPEQYTRWNELKSERKNKAKKYHKKVD